METRISATEASRGFSDVLNRVEYGNESFVVERGGKPVCRISPAPEDCTGEDVLKWWANRPKVDPGWCDDVEWAIKNQGELPTIEW